MNEPLSRWSLAGVLIANRQLSFGLFGGGCVYLVLTLLGWLHYQCPVYGLTRRPCPGCGMTRSSMALLHGDWKQSLAYHAFTGVFLLLALVVAIGLLLPVPQRTGYLRAIDRFEARTRWALWFGVILIVYALTRDANVLER